MKSKTKRTTSSAKSKRPAMPSPERIMDAVTAYQRSEAIKSAVELDLFTAIDEGNSTLAALAVRCKAAERGVRILCDYLSVAGFLNKKSGRYGLAPDAAAFLSRRSPAFMGSITQFLIAPHIKSHFDRLTASVQKGGTAAGEGSVAPEHPMWVDFARAMMPMMALPAELIANVLKIDSLPSCSILDIAAGHGIFGIMLAKLNPRAQVAALDWPNVLNVAQENAAKFGVLDRYRTLAGSAFDVDFGAGYDVVLLTNFLHHFDEATNVRLLKKVHAAMAPKGRAAILEFVPNEDRVTPPFPASFSLVMLGTTPRGDAYTYRQLQAMARKAGFSRTELTSLSPTPQTLVIAHKK